MSYPAKSSKLLRRSCDDVRNVPCPGELAIDSDAQNFQLVIFCQLALPKNRSRLVGFLFLEIVMVLHFDCSNVTFHLSTQLFILSRSRFRLAITASPSSEDLISQREWRHQHTIKYSGLSNSLPGSSTKVENKSGPSIKP